MKSFCTLLLALLPHLLTAQSLEPTWDSTYFSKHGEQLNDIILLADGRLALVGETNRSKHKEGLFMIVDAKTGEVQVRKNFGGVKDDQFYAVAEAEEGSFYLVGRKEQDNRKQAWLVRLDEQGNTLYDETFGDTTDRFEKIVWLDNGTGLLAGKNNHTKDGHIWLANINHKQEIFSQKYIGQGLFHNLTDMEKADGGNTWLCGNTRKSGDYRKGDIWTAIFDEKSKLRYEVFGGKFIEELHGAGVSYDGNLLMAGETWATNSSESDAWILEVDQDFGKIEKQFRSNELDFASSIQKSFFGNYWVFVHSHPTGAGKGTLTHELVVRGEDTNGEDWIDKYPLKLKRGEDFRAIKLIKTIDNKFIVAGNVSNKKSRSSIRLICIGDSELIAMKGLADVEFSEPRLEGGNGDNLLSPNERAAIKFDLTNTGKAKLYNIEIRAEAINPVEGLLFSRPVQYHSILAPDFEKTFFIPVIGQENLKAGTTEIEVVGYAKNEKIFSFTYPLKTIETSRGIGGSVKMSWIEPDITATGSREVPAINDYKTIKVRANVSRQVKVEDFKVYKDKSLLKHEKNVERNLTNPITEAGTFAYTFTYTIRDLHNGRNVIYVELDGVGSDSIVFIYEPEQPNLHVLAIGVTGGSSYKDLAFTAKDAQDFAEAVAKQNGKGFFKNIYIETLNTQEKTERDAIKGAFEDLYNKFQDDIIKPKDYLMVFYSGHGDKRGEKFYLIPSNYDSNRKSTTTIDYRAELREEFLDKILCKKILFIDACLSGAARSPNATDLGDAVIEANKAAPGMVAITSCSGEEFSYENTAGENGVFTEALLEVLEGKTVELLDGSLLLADQGGKEDLIELKELTRYLQKRVPDLAKTLQRGVTQTPSITANELDMDLTIFAIE